MKAKAIEKEMLRMLALEGTGASAIGIVRPGPVNSNAIELRRRWINEGNHSTMDYLTRYDEVRRDPQLLLEGARTMIIGLFNYANGGMTPGHPAIAEYALGTDYHVELRNRLEILGQNLAESYGGDFRTVTDTAPLRERYWAARAGLGIIGLNSQLIWPGHGAHFFIGTLLWTGEFCGDEDRPTAEPAEIGCLKCQKCVKACPTGALDGSGCLDARNCLSFLTIESRDALPEGLTTGGRLFGCDTCRRVCPMENLNERTAIDAFMANPDVTALTLRDWESMTPERFRTIFRHSAVRRAKLPHLQSILPHL